MLKHRTSALVLGICIVFLSALPANVLSQSAREVRTLETVKKLSAEIDQYIEDNKDQERIFGARRSEQGLWEWKELGSEDEEAIFFEGGGNYQLAAVWVRSSHVVFVTIFEGNDEVGDWSISIKYYFESKGRIIQVATDYRTLIDDIKVLDSQYFNNSGQVLEHSVEYYGLGWRGNQKLTEKPEHMMTPIHKIPVYFKVSDLPFYSLLKTISPKGNLLFRGNGWGETLHKYVSTVWHVDIGARLDRLAELNQIYLIP